jgi:hypothetical protein
MTHDERTEAIISTLLHEASDLERKAARLRSLASFVKTTAGD